LIPSSILAALPLSALLLSDRHGDSLYDCTPPENEEEIELCAATNIFLSFLGFVEPSFCEARGCCHDPATNLCFQKRVPAIPSCPRTISASDLSSEMLFAPKDGAIIAKSLTNMGMEESFTIMANYDPHVHADELRLLFSSRVLSEVEISKVHASVRDTEFHEDLSNRQLAMYVEVTAAGTCAFRMHIGTCETVTAPMPCPLQNRIAVQYSFNFTEKETKIQAEALDGTVVSATGACNRVKGGISDGLVVGANDIINEASSSDDGEGGFCEGTWSMDITVTNVKSTDGTWLALDNSECNGGTAGKCEAYVSICDTLVEGFEDAPCTTPGFFLPIFCATSATCSGTTSPCNNFSPNLKRTFSGSNTLMSRWFDIQVTDSSSKIIAHFCLTNITVDTLTPGTFSAVSDDGGTEITYTMEATCGPNYYGPRCCNYCPPPATDGTAHHDGCNVTDGTWNCIDEWIGDQCGFPPQRTEFVTETTGGALSNMAFYGVGDPIDLLFTSFRLATRVRSATFGRGVLFDRVFIVAPSDTANADFAGCDNRDVLLPFSFWRDKDDEGEYKYHAGWPNDLAPEHDYELRISWNHYTRSGTDAECWMPFKTTCGCSTADPQGIPVSFRTLETTTDMKFRWVDMSGCEEGYVPACMPLAPSRD